jgi:hypothetical protein
MQKTQIDIAKEAIHQGSYSGVGQTKDIIKAQGGRTSDATLTKIRKSRLTGLKSNTQEVRNRPTEKPGDVQPIDAGIGERPTEGVHQTVDRQKKSPSVSGVNKGQQNKRNPRIGVMKDLIATYKKNP